MESQGVHGLAGPRRVTSQRRLRHAFVYERALDLIVQATMDGGALSAGKRELAEQLGCSLGSVNEAVKRLERAGFIERLVNYGEWGQQMHNDYRATTAGIEEAARARDMRGDAS
ncbi:winged helix-turn-helix transcriptional regulator [Enorma phocaeensis]|uniref:winged helix-turn-helix transcriptional regulator n=1 Tax=Enorma phocaeensis TaxID=1871019 RepID=UPI00320968A2